MTKFFFKFKKSYIFNSPQFFVGKSFPNKFTFHRGFQHKIQKKLIIQFQEDDQADKRTNGTTNRGTDRPYFIRLFWLLPGDLISKTAVDRHLKVQDKEYDVALNKNYCITVSKQNLSSIYELILTIQQILGSHKLKGHAHFYSRSPKNH